MHNVFVFMFTVTTPWKNNRKLTDVLITKASRLFQGYSLRLCVPTAINVHAVIYYWS